VRVIVTHHIADDLGTLAERSPCNEPTFVAGVEYPTVDRLQAVAHVGKSPAHDHAHCVIEIAGLHLFDDVDAGVFFAAGYRGIDQIDVVSQNSGNPCAVSDRCAGNEA